MKKILAILLLAISIPAFAQHHHHHHGHWTRPDNSWNWVAPMIMGGVITYAVTRPPQPMVVQPTPPVIVQQQPNCGPWTQIQNADGTVTTSRTCYGLQ